MYGKIEEGAVTLWHEGSKEGFYPLVMTSQPSETAPEGYYYESFWRQESDSIVQFYELVEYPVTNDEILAILLGEGDEE